jgi:hypothetical protein
MIPHLLDTIAALNTSTVLFSVCLAAGIFMLLPRRH